ncbi:MAG: hypothetical protein VR64_22170 [Desulfatitalea sp. BRH_c12]|nr:MAG: hypothetical protein VR64_22170 [Desulfatitalea sp. BRH_c12]
MRNRWILTFLPLVAGMALFAAMGCSQRMSKSDLRNEVSGTIYQVSEKEALDLLHWAMQEMFPEETIYRLRKPRIGFFVHQKSKPGGDARYAKYKEKTYIYEAGLLPVQGTGPDGHPVSGFTYAVRGQGDLKGGPENVIETEKRIEAAFEQSGRAVMATAMTERPMMAMPPPVSAVETPDAGTPDASGDDPTPAGDDVFQKLERLKELHDKGVIDKEEFESKKKELLDRI